MVLCAAALVFAQPNRIVSTSPAITETLFAIGLGKKVVGVSTYCHYPPETAALPKVGTYLKPNVEVVARLEPDLVLVEKLPSSVAVQLKALSIRVAEITTGNLAQNLNAIVAIGTATGAEARARELTAGIRKELDTMREKMRGKPVRSAVFIVGREPGRLEDLVVVGGGSYLNELMEAAGGRNIFANESRPYLKTSLESILRRDPDVLIDMGEMAETVGVTDGQKKAVIDLWRTQPSLKAVRTNNVYAVASDIYVVPSPRMIDAARAFAKLFHPERETQ
jgi:iron complex transport system substrate-binding protein